MKRKNKCTICDDTGEFTNCFDQTFKCDCNIKKKKSNIRFNIVWDEIVKGLSEYEPELIRQILRDYIPDGKYIIYCRENEIRITKDENIN